MATQVVTPAKSFNIMMLINVASGILVAALPVVTSALPILQGLAPKIYGVIAALLPFANLIAHKSTTPVAPAAPAIPATPVDVAVAPVGAIADAATADAPAAK